MARDVGAGNRSATGRRAAFVAVCAIALGACTNDYDTLGSGSDATSTGATTSSAGGSSTATTSTGGATGGVGGVAGAGGAPAGTGGGGVSTGATGGVGGTGGTPPCGNGALDGAEACDDGNPNAGDGCSADCAIESDDGPSCPGFSMALTTAGVWIADTTVGKPDPENTACGGNTAGDLVYKLTPATAGTLTATLTGNFSSGGMVLGVTGNCGGWRNCTDGAGPLVVTTPVAAGAPVYVIVTGGSGAEGAFTLHIQLS